MLLANFLYHKSCAPEFMLVPLDILPFLCVRLIG
jgi:hypothetical protein